VLSISGRGASAQYVGEIHGRLNLAIRGLPPLRATRPKLADYFSRGFPSVEQTLDSTREKGFADSQMSPSIVAPGVHDDASLSAVDNNAQLSVDRDITALAQLRKIDCFTVGLPTRGLVHPH
jgi:hypothetical protein